MEASKRVETFVFAPGFLDMYASLVLPYSSGSRAYSVAELASDLCQKLGCQATALLQFGASDRPSAVLCYPDKSRVTKLVSSLLRDQHISILASELCEAESYTGESRLIAVGSRERDASIATTEIDLIPLPRHPEWSNGLASLYLFILVDASQLSYLPNQKADRDAERAMIAQFLHECWDRFSVPRSRRRLSGTVSEPGEPDSLFLPSWLYTATLPELIQEGIASARFVRRRRVSKEICFEGEVSAHPFAWRQWIPRFPFFQLSSAARKENRSRARSLIYWCRWVGSHPDLEEELDTSKSMVRQGPDSEKIPVSEWVRLQREEPDQINKRIAELCLMASGAFSIVFSNPLGRSYPSCQETQ